MRYITTWVTKAEAIFGRALWKSGGRVTYETARTALRSQRAVSDGVEARKSMALAERNKGVSMRQDKSAGPEPGIAYFSEDVVHPL